MVPSAKTLIYDVCLGPEQQIIPSPGVSLGSSGWNTLKLQPLSKA